MTGRRARAGICVSVLVVLWSMASTPSAVGQSTCGGGSRYRIEVRRDRGSGVVIRQCPPGMAIIMAWARFDELERAASAPTEDLGERFLIVVTRLDPGEGPSTVRQELYPGAAGGPLVYAAPGQIVSFGDGDEPYTVPSGWAEVSATDDVADLLRRNGIPLPLVAPTPTLPPIESLSTPAAAGSLATRGSSDDPSGRGPDAVTVLFVGAVLAATGVWFLRRRGT